MPRRTVSARLPGSPSGSVSLTRTVTVVPSGVCLPALDSTLASTWCSRCSSPLTSTGSSGSSRTQRWPGRATWASLVASMTSRVMSTGSDASGRPASSRASSSSSSTRTLIRVDSDSTRPSAWVTCSGRVAGVAQRQLGVAADGRQRGAQLVRRVGGEPAQPGLAGRAPPERGLHVAEHPVEGEADLAGLGRRVGVGDAGRQLDLVRFERQLGHLGRGGGDPAQRAEREPDPEGAAGARPAAAPRRRPTASASATRRRVSCRVDSGRPVM